MKEFAVAFAKAQAKIKTALKESENPAFKVGGKVSRYADLGAVWDACREALTSNGFSVLQPTNFDGADMWLETMLLHSSGDVVTGRYPIRPAANTPQAVGSAITYARRYALSSMLGVVADDDDDGNAASQGAGGGLRAVTPPPKPDKAKQTTGSYTDEALETLKTLKTPKDLNKWLDDEAPALAKLEKLDTRNSERLQDAITVKMDGFNNLKAG